MEKLLTVSVAAYNVEQYLGQTLRSLTGSSELLEKIEVLVINDGSTDHTAQIAKQWEKQYPDTFRLITKTNGGHGSTLNCSIKAAKGKYFRMLDGDDWYDTVQLETFVKKLEETNADLILTPYERINEGDGHSEVFNNHQLNYGQLYPLKGETYRKLENLQVYEMTVKTSLLKDHSVHLTEHCYYTDTALVIYMFLFSDTIIKFSDNVYRYRWGVSGQSVSDLGRKRHWKDGGRVTIDIVNFISPYMKQYSQEKRNYLYHLLCGSLNFHYRSFLLVDDLEIVKPYVHTLNNRLKSLDQEFAQYIDRTSKWKRLTDLLLFVLPEKYERTKKGIVIFGAGTIGDLSASILREEHIPIAAIADNQKEKWGQKLYDIPICSPANAFFPDETTYFIAVLRDAGQIREQLKQMGIHDENIIAAGLTDK